MAKSNDSPSYQGLLGIETRNSTHIEIGGAMLIIKDNEEAGFHNVSLLTGYSFSAKTVNIEGQYAYMFAPFISGGVNLNTTIKDGSFNLGIKPIVGFDAIVATVFLGYNIPLNDSFKMDGSAFSVAFHLRLPLFFALFKK